jgi:hypothetical protein
MRTYDGSERAAARRRRRGTDPSQSLHQPVIVSETDEQRRRYRLPPTPLQTPRKRSLAEASSHGTDPSQSLHSPVIVSETDDDAGPLIGAESSICRTRVVASWENRPGFGPV